eukprot:GHVN01019075.1.p2 GENE.GHVN01019075.1~~GHVN01019075.1.p2  ORF type:complete len:161 (-),score=19.75 GHVN01019075.1:51-533(-)
MLNVSAIISLICVNHQSDYDVDEDATDSLNCPYCREEAKEGRLPHRDRMPRHTGSRRCRSSDTENLHRKQSEACHQAAPISSHEQWYSTAASRVDHRDELPWPYDGYGDQLDDDLDVDMLKECGTTCIEINVNLMTMFKGWLLRQGRWVVAQIVSRETVD